jgi:hypothetical protein
LCSVRDEYFYHCFSTVSKLILKSICYSTRAYEERRTCKQRYKQKGIQGEKRVKLYSRRYHTNKRMIKENNGDGEDRTAYCSNTLL